MRSPVEIGRCSVCRRMARLQHGGCADCGSRLGQRFIEVAARVRTDPKLAAMVLGAIRDPVHKKLFVQYFGSEENCMPPDSRPRSVDKLR